jgi:hypothetical protein
MKHTVILDTDYMARVERAVKDKIHEDAIVLAIIEYPSIDTTRDDYWERAFQVAWYNGSEAGTHRAHVDSTGEAALFFGHYQMTTKDAIRDCIERAGF